MIFSRLPRSAPVMAAMCVLAALAVAQGRSATHIVPFFPAASDTRPQGLVRIVNLADEPGTLDIVAIDAAGARFEGVSLALGAGETAHFDSDDLESGNADAGLTGATGPGQGDWRLELNSTLDLEVQAYVRTREGELAEMYETAAGAGDRFRIATFNPGSNVNQVGLLWLFNRGDEPVAVTVQGTDDLGQSPGPGVSIDLPAREARTYTAAELESGAAPGLSGSLGDGAGKWRLDGEASGQVLAMSLISSPTGHLTNLSTLPSSVSDGVHRVPLFPPASDTLGRQGFARVINRSEADGEVRIEAFDGTDWSYEALTLTLEAGETQQFNSTDLELGNPAKGLTGSTGAGDGDWRLELRSELDLEVLSYVRTVGGQGYVTPMHDTAAREAEGLMRYYVPIFHAAEYEAQESRLHLFNAGEAEARVGIAGLDDAGLPPPEGDVSLVLGAGETRVVTAEELENGGEGLDGWFGSGAGRWRLLVSSGEALQVMSLGYGADGFLANLSRGSPPAYAVQSGAPDLVVETLSVSDGTPDSGETFTLSAMVRNRGDGDAEATTLRYYRSTNANISASDLEVGTVRVDALSASGSGDESIALAAPSEAGTYYYGACADPVADESDIANNCSAAVPLTVSEQGESSYPDLVVSRPTVSKDATRTGGSVHALGHSAQRGRRRLAGDDSALLPVDRRHDLAFGYGGGHQTGDWPRHRRKQWRIDRLDGAGKSRHLLLRCLCRCGRRGGGCIEQLLGGGRRDRDSASAEPDGGPAGGRYRQPRSRRRFRVVGERCQRRRRRCRCNPVELLPLRRCRRHRGGHAGRQRCAGRARGRRPERRIDSADGARHCRHVLLRGLRRIGFRGIRHHRQLLVFRGGDGCGPLLGISGPGGRHAHREREPAGARECLRADGHGTQYRRGCVERDDATLLPLDGCGDFHVRYAGRHGRGGSARCLRHQPPRGHGHGAGHCGHVLLRGVRGHRYRRDRCREQLFRGGRDRGGETALSGSCGGCASRQRKHPSGRCGIHTFGDGDEPGRRGRGGDDVALLPIGRRDNHHGRRAGGNGTGGRTGRLRDERGVDRTDGAVDGGYGLLWGLRGCGGR